MNKEQNLQEPQKQALRYEKIPYCTDCGNDDLAYIAQYANGEYWKCKECGKEFIW